MNLQQRLFAQRAGVLNENTEIVEAKYERPTTAPSQAILDKWAATIRGVVHKKHKSRINDSSVFKAIDKLLNFDISYAKFMTKDGKGVSWVRKPEPALVAGLIGVMKPPVLYRPGF